MYGKTGIPTKQGLYNPEFEHDSCGVGFVANINGVKTHKIVENGIEVLENLKHRGAVGADPKTGDGAGIMTQVPDKFLRKVCKKVNIYLPTKGNYGVGLVFLPVVSEDRHFIENLIEKIVSEEGQIFLGFRDVPFNDSEIGKVAISVMPVFKHLLIGKSKRIDSLAFERKLLVIRKRIGIKVSKLEIGQKNYFYICSLSSKTLIYKGQLMPEQLKSFFPDLNDKDYKSAIALVHSRYSTNTFPTWALAHPYRYIAHNGEINTLKGNANWFNVREQQFKNSLFGKDLKKIMPAIAPSKSDSAAFDNVLEFLILSGRSLPHALMMMIPEAYTYDKNIIQYKKDFYQYHSCLMEPWDGPSAICFSDGRYIGSVLDRNGLRPLRYWVTDDSKIIMSSEVGPLKVDPNNIIEKGRLQPGKLFLVDTKQKRIIRDSEIKKEICQQKDYSRWVKRNIKNIDSLPIPASNNIKNILSTDESTIIKQKIFGYTLEDLKFVIKPILEDGKEATGSMGADTPLAIFSKRPQLLFNYFKQLFAQVTNPPIDPIREEVVMSGQVLLGKELNLLEETPEHCKRIKLDSPIISNTELQKIKFTKDRDFTTTTVSILFNKNLDGNFQNKLKQIFIKVREEIKKGTSIIILSDRGANTENIPIPSLLAGSGLHHSLVKNGNRAKVSIILETGEAREIHHFATLIGYGVNAVNPYMVYETIGQLVNNGELEKLKFNKYVANYHKAVNKGLFKVISKMGISTIQSYCGAQIFEAIGLSEEFIEKYFTGTSSRIGGIGIRTIEKETFIRHSLASVDRENENQNLAQGGYYAWRANGEKHNWNPETISLLQQSVRSNDYKVFKRYSKIVNDPKRNFGSIKSYLKFRKSKPISIDRVEPVTEIVKRFASGAMSFGSISKEAHETIAIAMNELGGYSNTGEGGENPIRFTEDENGKLKRSRIKQIAQGRFGVTIEYLVNADQLQIKMAQGAKPGEGGQLPGAKVSEEIAKTRYTTQGVGLISPPPHHDIYSIEDLAQLIYDLKKSNPSAQISVKLVSEAGVGTIAAGVSKGKADLIIISGAEGGTGASPLTSIKNAGLPMELGIAETQQVLVMNDLRRRVRIQVDGQLKTGRDVIIGAMLGADEFGFATSVLITMGCIMLRKCHLNACSVGIATQDKKLRENFVGHEDHIKNYFLFIAEEVREIMAKLGIEKFDNLIGRTDLLVKRNDIKHWKAKHINLSTILHRPDVPAEVELFNASKQNHNLEYSSDVKLIELCKKAIHKKTSVRFSSLINNSNRAVGTMLSSVIAKKYGLKGLPSDTIQIDFEGSAGQSFGAFLAKGITLRLEGDANDYVGKGLSGGKIIITTQEDDRLIPEKNIIVGNVVLYGAIKGEMYINGKAGERFAVRNSGAKVVVEGIGDHGCEYMTGGRVVVLGEVGRNFGAGMSGGIAYVWDKNKKFIKMHNREMVHLYAVKSKKHEQELKKLVTQHYEYTDSKIAKGILGNWEKSLTQFVKVFPKDYQRVLKDKSVFEQPPVYEYD
ncbi:MAG: glutamate synthase large subunit [Ignavibacteriae bacterium]|nr:glutamate synthase large subunit [Ignavibacteriota bacterium]